MIFIEYLFVEKVKGCVMMCYVYVVLGRVCVDKIQFTATETN